MRRAGLALALLAGALLGSGPCAADELEEPLTGLERRIAEAVNARRASRGLDQLGWSDAVAALARRHNAAMAGGRVGFGHDGFEARAAQIAKLLPLARAAENIFRTTPRDDDLAAIALERWVGSRVHLENLEGAFDVAGVGAALASGGDVYVTQIFVALRPGAARAPRSGTTPGGALLEALLGLPLLPRLPVVLGFRAVDDDPVLTDLRATLALRRALATERQRGDRDQ